jgi:hypothetical protein
MQYPGRIIKTGERDPEIIRALKTQLNQELGTQDDPALRLDPDEPDFGPKMAQAVRLFQARHVDVHGQPLKQDGEVGSMSCFVKTPIHASQRPYFSLKHPAA